MNDRQKVSNRIALFQADVDFIQKLLEVLPAAPEFSQEAKVVSEAFTLLKAKFAKDVNDAKDAKNENLAELLKDCDHFNSKILLLFGNLPAILYQLCDADEINKINQALQTANTQPAALAVSNKDDKTTENYRSALNKLGQIKSLSNQAKDLPQKFNRFVDARTLTYGKLVRAERSVKYKLEKFPESKDATLTPNVIYVKVGLHLGKDALCCRFIDLNWKPVEWYIDGFKFDKSGSRVENKFTAVIKQLTQSKGDPKAIEQSLPAIVKQLAKMDLILLSEPIINAHTKDLGRLYTTLKDTFPALYSLENELSTVNTTLQTLPTSGIVYSRGDEYFSPLVFGYRKGGFAIDHSEREITGTAVTFNNLKLKPCDSAHPFNTPDFTSAEPIHNYQFLFRLSVNSYKESIRVKEINPLYAALFKTLFAPQLDCKAVALEVNNLLKTNLTSLNQSAATMSASTGGLKSSAAVPSALFQPVRADEIKKCDKLSSIRDELLVMANGANNGNKLFLTCVSEVLNCHPELGLNKKMGARFSNFLYPTKTTTAGASGGAAAVANTGTATSAKKLTV